MNLYTYSVNFKPTKFYSLSQDKDYGVTLSSNSKVAEANIKKGYLPKNVIHGDKSVIRKLLAVQLEQAKLMWLNKTLTTK